MPSQAQTQDKQNSKDVTSATSACRRTCKMISAQKKIKKNYVLRKCYKISWVLLIIFERMSLRHLFYPISGCPRSPRRQWAAKYFDPPQQPFFAKARISRATTGDGCRRDKMLPNELSNELQSCSWVCMDLDVYGGFRYVWRE